MKNTRKTTESLYHQLHTGLLYILPHHFLSRVMLKLTRIENKLWKNALIHWVMNKYSVQLDQAVTQDPSDYPSFNAFFTRALQANARPLDEAENSLCSPVDGVISQLGEIQHDQRLIQAKGQS